MNIKCFSDLEAWMQGVVDQVKVATGTTRPVCLQVNVWSRGALSNDMDGSSVWVDEHGEHYNFKNYQELCAIVERFENPPILFRRFEL